MRRLIALYFILGFYPALASICHPTIDHGRPQYIVGYGSLIDEASKNKTDPTAEQSVPVIIKGYQRRWSAHSDAIGLRTTFLSVSKHPFAWFNGVIYQLRHPNNILSYDKREHIYCRKELQPAEFSVFATTLPTEKQVWMYIPKKKYDAYPTPDYPIVQSYVDIFIRGCIKIEEKFHYKDFAKNCITQTAHWPSYWINDRIFPRRATAYEPYASKIDALLYELVPVQFKQITL